MRRILLLAALMMWAGAAGATNYLVDSVTGDNGDSGLTEALAWATMNGKIEALTAGDTVFVRSRHEETLSSDIALTGDGTADSPVVIWGDDAGSGPDRYWQYDSGDSIATVTCGNFQLAAVEDNNWHVHRIKWTGINEYAINYNIAGQLLVTNCHFWAMTASSDFGITVGVNAGTVVCRNCTFNGGGQGVGIYGTGGYVYVDNCTFDNLTAGIEKRNTTVEIVNSDFGQSTANTADVKLNNYSTGSCSIFGGLFTDNSKIVDVDVSGRTSRKASITRYYIDGAKRPMAFVSCNNWEALNNYAVYRDGGAPYSVQYSTPIAQEPGSYQREPIMGVAVYADSAETRTYSLYAYRDANWGSAPAANELYIEVQYQFADTIRSEVSTQTLTNAETWYALSVADVSPQHDGPVLITLWLGDYDANGKIHVDPRLVATGESYHETSWWPDMLSYFYQAPAAGGVPWKQIF